MAALAAVAASADDDTDTGSSSYQGPTEEEIRLQEVERKAAEERRKAAEEARKVAELRAAEAERLRLQQEKEAWLKMSPDERVAVTIKKMWVAPCKDWMCMN